MSFFGFLIVERFDYSGNIFVTQIKPSLNRFALTERFIVTVEKRNYYQIEKYEEHCRYEFVCASA